MKPAFNKQIALLGFLALALAPALAFAADVAVNQPIGVAADVNRVLVTTPWCGAPKKIFDIKSGTAVEWATVAATDTSCAEIYIAISPGLNGFTAGDVFVTYDNKVWKVTPAGPTLFATPQLDRGTHGGIVFDRVGTFGYNLIVTSTGGTVSLIDHTGAVVHSFVSPGGGIFPIGLEVPDVAPLNFGPWGGYLWSSSEGDPAVYAVAPYPKSVSDPTHASVKLPLMFEAGNSPESIRFLGRSVCSVSIGGVNASYIDAIYGANLVRPYDVTAYPSRAIMNEEFSGDAHFLSYLGAYDGMLIAGLPQQENAATVTPRTDTPGCDIKVGCTLTQGAYKNHFNYKLINYPPGTLYLGTVAYTNAQLDSIMQNTKVKGNGLISLAHQLITAQMNIYYGAFAPPQVASAIVQANALIGAAFVPPVGGGYLNPSVTSALVTMLTDFNEGKLGVPHCE